MPTGGAKCCLCVTKEYYKSDEYTSARKFAAHLRDSEHGMGGLCMVGKAYELYPDKCEAMCAKIGLVKHEYDIPDSVAYKKNTPWSWDAKKQGCLVPENWSKCAAISCLRLCAPL